MFGHNDDNQQTDQNQTTTSDTPAYSAPPFTPPPVDPAPSATLDTTADTNMELPGSSSLPGDLTASEPSKDESAAPQPATTAPTSDASASAGLAASPNDLIRIKQEALQQLAPLVDHLDQTPEERFRTTMMMIQATDDSSKIQDAHEAALLIEDEKVRAQALLDVVNEINYFTQQNKEAA